MTKPSVFAALVLVAAPLAAFADPMSVGGDGYLLAAATSAPSAAAGGGGASMADPADTGDEDAPREPLTTAAPAAPRSVRRQRDTTHASAHTPVHAGIPAHKKAEATRWQSLLPGVMK
ncbi:MAG: hypothetical protein KGH80_05610 [Xanthomonadaceae bacterium]|nr:hypothetical protein [Xanthomonadaceae bacterium]